MRAALLRRTKRAAALFGLAGAVYTTLVVTPTTATAQEPTRARDEDPSPSTDLRARFGVDVADRLLRSPDSDDRVRGVRRAAADATPEAVALLIHATETNGIAHADARVAIELSRALAAFTDDPKVRIALENLTTLQPSTNARQVSWSTDGDADEGGRMKVARAAAALALAATHEPTVVEWLIATVRAGTAGGAPASAALAAYPPSQPGAFSGQNASSPAVIRLAGALGDLRALDVARAAARSTDPALRAAGLATLGEMGDMRVLPFAIAGAKENDPRLRIAAAETLVDLGVPERLAAVEKLITDDTTAAAGVRLAERAPSPGAVKALAARARASADPSMRAAAIAALGRSTDPSAVLALLALGTGGAEADVAAALATSPSPDAMAAIQTLASGPAAPAHRLGARAYVTRALERRETSAALEALVASLAASRDPKDRAVGAFAQIALGERDLASSLADSDPRVRRAAAIASLARGEDASDEATLLARLANEKDEPTREVLALGLLGGDPDCHVPTLALVDRAESSGPDAPLAAMALARRADDDVKDKVDKLLASPDPVLRAHAARGIGMSAAKDAAGRLAGAYAYEADANVRRAIVLALASRTGDDRDSPSRMDTLRAAARLDPSGAVRNAATRALAGLPTVPAAGETEVAWLRLTTPDGRDAPPALAGALVRGDGLAVPFVFDDDGFALIPGVPAGDAQLVLAPRLPAYEGGAR